MAKSAFNTIT